jgi:hypothetical protein
MPECTWTATLTAVGVIAGALGVAVLVTGLMSTWQTRRLQAKIAQVFRAIQQHFDHIMARMDRWPETPGKDG